MTFWIIYAAIVFAICALLAGLIIPQILLIAFRKKLFDEPDERKIHKGVVPRLGGLAFAPVIFFAIALMYGACQLLGYGDMSAGIYGDGVALTFCFCSILLLYLTGMADDLIGIRYRAKFIIQIICSLLVIAGGLRIGNLHGLFGIHGLPLWLGYPLTVLVIVFITNAINLIDGLDGLASGLSEVAVLFYGVVFLLLGEYLYAVLSFATLGVLIPFFYYNVFGDANRHKKIFMGDTGSLTLGMILCILSLKLLQCDASGASGKVPNVFILAYSPLLVPCLDVVRVYLHRVRNGKNPFLPDKNHIHHKLLAVGMSRSAAMHTIVLGATVFSLCNILASKYVNVTVLIVIDILIYTFINIWLTRRISSINTGKVQ